MSSQEMTGDMPVLATDLHTPPLGEVGTVLEVSGDNLTGALVLKLPEKSEQ